jgi:hypothetical protein
MRDKALVNHGVNHPVETIRPGKYPDGITDQHGTPAENVHGGKHPEYESPEGRRYREDLRARPSAPEHQRRRDFSKR